MLLKLRTLPLQLLALSIVPLSAATAATAASGPALDAAVRQRAELLVRNGGNASIVIAVTDGKNSAVYGFGRAQADSNTVPDADTVYEIGSVTKTMTGLLLADAVVTGKARLDQPVVDLLPGYTIPTFEGQQITLLDLATHFSGLPRLPANLAPADMSNPYAEYGDAQLRTFLASHALAHRPGTVFEYSNLGYGLLGTALATQAGTSYENLLQEKIARPLGLRSTSTTATPAMRIRLAQGHLSDGKLAHNWDFQAIAPAGAVYSDARDMLIYLQSYMNKSSAAQQLAVQPQKSIEKGNGTRIGLAWIIDQAKGQPYAWHNGQTGGYASFAGYTLNGKRGVIILSSTANDVDGLGLASLVPGTLPALKKPTPLPKEIAIAPSELAQYAGDYTLAPNFILTVRQGPDGLLVGATGQGEAPVYASAKDRFFYKAVDAQLEFKRDGKGVITGLVLKQDGQTMPAQRKPQA
ncbi:MULTISPECIES: serine hydrolase [unclassified Janthinobacterium]|uniref:serine hydrolase n=1 Tax=unclassified Janthinobacterium TaxID=2610881 RepID=UPI00161B72C8|nr:MULTISPECIES: serine hydrolase [unclassified Janthinobacterium]MBB5606447.1 CubicO group peptidase (beta-lactamase class C family) [Janthinobacterium sp. S3T4]MBB5611681.1 CubicO group peptidase (beta-lactamase class C family) [Janthinobacterium sp. S3M3]